MDTKSEKIIQELEKINKCDYDQDWRVQSSSKERFTCLTESITGKDLQHI